MADYPQIRNYSPAPSAPICPLRIARSTARPGPPSRTLIEIVGGIWIQGRHNRAAGLAADLEESLEAALAGWRVVRLGPNELTADHVERLIGLVRTDDL